MNQDAVQDAAGGGSGSTSLGFTTGTKCTSSGTYRASNRYMDLVALIAEGDVFPPFCDGKKTTWFQLTASLSTNDGGSFKSVKVDAGTV